MREAVNGLWIIGPLSALELLTIHSFINNGFTFILWTYDVDTIINAPESTIIKDANEIIPYDEVFVYTTKNKFGHGKGSYAGFSDIFRYKLLYEHGGIWTDMDVTCLKPLAIESDYLFRHHHKAGAVGNIMKCPKNAPIMQWCYEQAKAQVNANNTDWMLPIKILNEGINKFRLNDSIFKISNHDSFPEIIRLLTSNKTIPNNWHFIHWMNEEWRCNSISKNKFIHKSTIARLLSFYGIAYNIYDRLESLGYHLFNNRIAYILRNIINKIR